MAAFFIGMAGNLKSILVQTTGGLVAAGLTYLALRNVDFSGMWDALRNADYMWLVPVILVTLLAHFLRAWRWRMFIDALPQNQRVSDGPRVTLGLAFNSVMIGYLINNAVPRLGEFARAANLSSQAKWRFSSVFGTVVVERVLDMAALLVILVGVGVLVAGSPAGEAVFFGPLKEQLAELTIGEVAVALALIGVVGFVLFRLPRILRRPGSASSSFLGKIAPIIESFREGFLTLFRSKQRLGISLTTIAIWICYWLMLYLPLFMLHLDEPYGLGAGTALVILGIGSLGFVVPAPGGIGAYHYFVIETLVQLYGVPYDEAAGFAVLTHAAQLILFALVGFICLLAQGSSISSMLQIARDARDDSGDAIAPQSGAEGYISR